MKIVNSPLNTAAQRRAFRPLSSGFQGALLFLIMAASSVSAAVSFDNSTSSKAKHNTSEISWKHTIGVGSDRALLVAVSFNDYLSNNDHIATVKINNVAMRPVPGSQAASSGMLIRTTTQLFYLTGDEMPAPGTYDVVVGFTGKVYDAAGGSVSLFGVEPGAPAAVATNSNLLGLGQISTTINAPAYSWVVDVAASASGADLIAGAGQTETFKKSRRTISIAGSVRAAAGEATTLFWQQNDSSSLVTSAVAFAAKPDYRLSLATTGAGTIQLSPGGDMFHAGQDVTLIAVPAEGWRFAGWGGDLSGTDSPSVITMNAEKYVTAGFVQVPPSISTQPASQTVPVGSNVGFTVAADGTVPFTYQWHRDGVEIEGAISDTLSLTNVREGDAGTYSVTVTNGAGSAVSSGAFLTVVTPPSILIQPEPQTVNAGAAASFFVVAGGTAPLSYQWQRDGSPIAGADAATLSIADVQESSAGIYTVVVSNAAGSITSDAVALNVTNIVVPTIITQPVSQTANVGETVVFSVAANGTAPFNYQWQKNGSDIPGATGESLTLSNVQLSDAGDYSVEVSNDAGVDTSEQATLTVEAPPAVSLRERFADGDRTTQNLPASAAWFTSSGSNNLTATAGQATQIVSSSRTLLGYFTGASANPVTVGVNQTLALDFTVQFSGFDTAASAGSTTFSVGLLRSVANPSAVSGTGFVASGSPNTNARVTGDFGSNNPASNVFTNYGGYAAMTYTGQSGAATPVRLYARTGANASLLNSTSPYTQFTTGGAVTPSTGMLTNTDYRGTMTIENTGSGILVGYTLRDAATGSVVMTYSATQAAGSFTEFDTAAFYLSKASASANYNLVIKAVDVTLAGSGDAGDPPSITTQPVSRTVAAGADVSFTVAAEGTGPLSYQWHKNGSPIAGANSATLNLSNVQSTDAGSYRAVVSNAAGSATSTTAVLNVETGPTPPVITSQPASQTVVTGASAGFAVIATGTAPLSYQWYKDGSPLTGANSSTLNLSNVQESDAGGYSVVVGNGVGYATSSTATLSVTDQIPGQIYNVEGFARAATGGGILPETDPNYRKVYTVGDLVAALGNRNTKIIEIMNDLDLGYNEVPASARTGALRAASAPLLHPVLLASGVSTIDIQDKNGLTIFSANGATIRHANFNVKRANNVIIRNLKFDELWEWDESSKGKYDKQGWDFITVDMTSDQIWIDHCTFTKAYDGVVDIKGGTRNITISWSSFIADDGGPNSFVRRQIEALEENRSAYAMYNFLRSNGFSVEDIIAVSRSQKKGHLVGANEFDTANSNHRVTLHHNYYLNMQDRLPRLRAGNAHIYNIYVNNTEALAAKDLRNARVAAMTSTNASRLTGSSPTYSFDVTLNGAISTEGGAVLVEKSQIVDVLFPLRNNQVSASQPNYTGKVLALDTLYQLRGSVFRGDSNTPGSPLAPVPAPELPFSWNGFETLPYSYTAHDPTQLPWLLTGAEGAGAGSLFWPRENWLMTTY